MLGLLARWVLLARLRGEENGHIPSLQLGCFVQGGHFGTQVGKLIQQITSDVGVRHLTAAEADGYLDAVAVSQELLRVLQLGVEVAHVDARGHTDLFDLHDVLVLSGFFFPLALLELELAVIHQLAHRGRGLRGNLHQIQSLLLRDAQSFLAGHDTQLLSALADESDLLIVDLFIQLMLYLANTEAPPIQNKNADASGIRTTTQATPQGRSCDAVDLFAIAGGEADAPTFFVFHGIVYHRQRFVNGFFEIFRIIFPVSGETTPVPRYRRDLRPHQNGGISFMENTKNTKNANTNNNENTQNTNNTNNTNNKNGKNAKNSK